MRWGSRAKLLKYGIYPLQSVCFLSASPLETLTSSSAFTSSGCLLAMCFSTNDVALKSFEQCLHLNLPSSSCLIYGSTALLSSLRKNEIVRRVPHIEIIKHLLIITLSSVIARVNAFSIDQECNLRIQPFKPSLV